MDLDEADELGESGRRLFQSLSEPHDPYELTTLITEAARIKDRLDKFARLLSGDLDMWLRLIPSRGDVDVLEIRADSALQESRQLATVLRHLLSEIRRQKGNGGGVEQDDLLADL